MRQVVMPKKYRKKPVVIEALRFEYSHNGIKALMAFCPQVEQISMQRHPGAKATCVIPTLEGNHTATEGDYIIRGVAGEFYPCKPDIFAKTYELCD